MNCANLEISTPGPRHQAKTSRPSHDVLTSHVHTLFGWASAFNQTSAVRPSNTANNTNWTNGRTKPKKK